MSGTYECSPPDSLSSSLFSLGFRLERFASVNACHAGRRKGRMETTAVQSAEVLETNRIPRRRGRSLFSVSVFAGGCLLFGGETFRPLLFCG